MIPDIEIVRDDVEARIQGQTVLGGFLDTVARLPGATALRWKEEGAWRSLSWQQYADVVHEVSVGLQVLGFGPGEFVLVLSGNRPEPHVADLAAQAAGGAAGSVSKQLPPEEIGQIARNCEATFLIVEDTPTLLAVAAVRGALPAVRTVVVLNGDGREEEGGVITWRRLVALGREHRGDREDFFVRAAERLRSEDLATLIYTSGTTGAAKGVMLTHRNVRWAIAAGFWTEGAHAQDDTPSDLRIISYLPLGTVGARMVDHWAHVVLGGAVINFCPEVAQLPNYLRDVRPSLFMGNPAIFDRLKADINAAIDNDPEEQRRHSIRQCLAVGRQLARFRARGEQVPANLRSSVGSVLAILKSVLGMVGLDQCGRVVSGGAPIDPEVIEFFQSLGLTMTQSWGMTELTTAVTGDGAKGSVGTPYPGVELKLNEDGEIVVRGGMVMKGYYRDARATASVLDGDGWLRTGDIGAFGEDGTLYIVGRKKDLIVTAAGTNIVPTRIELLLQRHPLIGQACAIGDRRSYVTALLTIDPDEVGRWARRRGYGGYSRGDLTRLPELTAEVRDAVVAVNAQLPGTYQVRRFRILPDVWTVDSGELTSTYKIRREMIVRRNADLIDEMYAEAPLGVERVGAGDR